MTNDPPVAKTIAAVTMTNTPPTAHLVSLPRPIIGVEGTSPNNNTLTGTPPAMDLDELDFDADGGIGISVGPTNATEFHGPALDGKLLLLKSQTTPSQNGLYVYNDTAHTLTRSTRPLFHGQLFGVRYGQVNAGKTFRLTTADPITPGVTGLAFEEVTEFAGPPIPIAL